MGLEQTASSLRLKPKFQADMDGTAKAVPFQSMFLKHAVVMRYFFVDLPSIMVIH